MTTTMSSPASGKKSPELQPPPVQSPKRTRPWGLILPAIFVVAGLGGGAIWWGMRVAEAGKQIEQIDKFTVQPRSFLVTLKEKGELKAAESNQLKCEVEGRSTIIHLIEEGAQVEQGDLLVELASDQIDDRLLQEELKEANALMAYESAQKELEIQRDKNASDIRKANLQIELAQLALDKYEKGDWQQQLQDSQIMIDQATITLDRRREDFEASKELYEKGYITEFEFKEDEFNYKKAQWDKEKAKRARDVLIEYTRKADKAQKESDLQEATKECERIVKNAEAEEAKRVGTLEAKRKELEIVREQLDKLRKQKEKCQIFAPTPGFVMYGESGDSRRFFRGDEGQIQEGATVYERQVLVTLPDTSGMVVSCRIHESKLAKLEMGQRATVEVEGIPGKQFTGAVSKIAQVADTQNRWINPDVKEYETEIVLDGHHETLKPGATAHVEILVTTVQDALAVPVQAIYTKAGHQFVFRSVKGDVEPVEIEIGNTNEEWAEVLEGLSGGDQVLLTFDENHKRMLPDLPSAAPIPEMTPGMSVPSAPPGAASSVTTSGGREKRGGHAADDGGKRRMSRRAGMGNFKPPSIEELRKIPGLENIKSYEELRNVKDPKVMEALREAMMKHAGGERKPPAEKGDQTEEGVEPSEGRTHSTSDRTPSDAEETTAAADDPAAHAEAATTEAQPG
jgi:HlyD family secretion protein